ncbi:MAG: hypothetical protein HY866_16050 [Chloroflexi bacterium]|nr:hypothetical protein [Chloroflexota bacterium]
MTLLLLISVCAGGMLPQQARAQDPIFPLPAPLYILMADQTVSRIDPVSGELSVVSPEGQPVIDFDISPDGVWYVYRTSSNNAVVVSEITGSSGYVLQFDEYVPPASSLWQTIAWSPDASAIAYTVPEGIRIARLSASDYGEALFDTVPGTFVELYWAAPGVLAASDLQANVTVIEWQNGAWITWPGGLPARPQPAVMSFLTPDGVTLENYLSVPGTKGILYFDWGPLLPYTVEAMVLPYDLYFIAEDTAGIGQVWQWPKTNAPARMITSETGEIGGYSLSPDQQQIVYITNSRVIAAGIDGANRRELGQIDEGGTSGDLDWSPDGTQIAYDDGRGIWITPADGSQPARIVAQTTYSDESPVDVRVLRSPQWSPDGTRLLVVIGFYEGSALGIVDVNTGTLTELRTGFSSSYARWTIEGKVITWAAGWGYTSPGLYLLDPNAPMVALLDERYAVLNAMQGDNGMWYALVGSTTGMGPQFLRVWAAESLGTEFAPLFDNLVGGFMDSPQIAPPPFNWVGPLLVAGIDSAVDPEYRYQRGDLLLLIPAQGTIFRVQTPGLVWRVQWGY